MNKEQAWLLEEKYQGVESDAFHADCARLEAGEPLAYLIGSIPFLDCQIYLDSRPLIPRPETEFWVEKAIEAISMRGAGSPQLRAPGQAFRQPMQENEIIRGERAPVVVARPPQRKYSERGLAEPQPLAPPQIKVLDLCAGSGAIGVAVAKAIPTANISFAEIDPTYLPTIKKNLDFNLKPESNYFKQKVNKVCQSDLFSSLSEINQFDFILCNPPYIDALAKTVDANVVEHEPHQALFGGSEGLELIAKIINQAKNYLKADGELWLEHEPAQKDAVLALGLKAGFSVVTHHDQYRIYRYSVLSVAQ